MAAGADAPVLAGRPHVQAVRVRVPGRRSREDRPAQPDARRRAVDGRLEEVLPGGHLELADQTHLPVGRRETLARQAQDSQAQSQVQGLPVVGRTLFATGIPGIDATTRVG